MKTKQQIGLIVAIALALIVIGFVFTTCQKKPEGHIVLSVDSLDFGMTITEQNFRITLGDMPFDTLGVNWKITSPIPSWVDIDPASGFLSTVVSDTDFVRVRVNRYVLMSGKATAVLEFSSERPGIRPLSHDDTLKLSVEKTCGLLEDDFNQGNAAGWDAQKLTTSQDAQGYVTLKPDGGDEGQLLRTVSTFPVPCNITARFRHSRQEVTRNQYGILLEDANGENTVYYAVKVDENTNYSFYKRQIVWRTLRSGKTNLISTRPGDWNTLRLELYETNQKIYARGYAGNSTQPLFDNVELGTNLKFIKVGIQSDEYIIDVDWICGSRG